MGEDRVMMNADEIRKRGTCAVAQFTPPSRKGARNPRAGITGTRSYHHVGVRYNLEGAAANNWSFLQTVLNSRPRGAPLVFLGSLLLL